MDTKFNLIQKVVTLEPKNIVFTPLKGEFVAENYMKAWQLLWDFIKAARCKNDSEIEEYCRECRCEYLSTYNNDPRVADAAHPSANICFALNDKFEPKGDVFTGTIGGGKYAVFTYVGPYENLGLVYAEIFSKHLHECGLQIREGICFDKYCNDPEAQKPEDFVTELNIPVK